MTNAPVTTKHFSGKAVLCLLLALCLTAGIFTGCKKKGRTHLENEAAPEMPYAVPGFVMNDDIYGITFANGLQVLCAGSFSGAYLEDGSDEQVTDVFAIVVKNNGGSLVEYGKIELPLSNKKTATFEFSGLPVGAAVLVQEKSRMRLVQGKDAFTFVQSDSQKQLGNAKDSAAFVLIECALPAAIVLDFGNDFEIYPDDGVLNIKNISGRDFTSDVSVFYKNFEYGLFMGGITYRARFTGGVKAGEIAQAMQNHYWVDTSAILYMAYAD